MHSFVGGALSLIRLSVLAETENLHGTKLERRLHESKMKVWYGMFKIDRKSVV